MARALLVSSAWIFVAAAGQNRPEYATPAEPIVANAATCNSFLLAYNKVVQEAQSALRVCTARSQGNGSDKRLSSQCQIYAPEFFDFQCKFAPSCVTAADDYYRLAMQQTAAGKRCYERAEQQSTVVDLIVGPSGNVSVERQFQSDLSERVRKLGDRALGDDTLQGRIFDGAMAAIGRSNDHVLKQLETALAALGGTPGAPSAASFHRLRDTIAMVGRSPGEIATARRLIDEHRRQTALLDPKIVASALTETSQMSYSEALALAIDMLDLASAHYEALRRENSRPIQSPSPSAPAIRPPSSSTNPPSSGALGAFVGSWRCQAGAAGYDYFTIHPDGSITMPMTPRRSTAAVSGSTIRFEQVDDDTTFYERRVFQFTLANGELRGTRTETARDRPPSVDAYACRKN